MAKLRKPIEKRRKNNKAFKYVKNKHETKMEFARRQNWICPLCGADMSQADPSKLHLDHNHVNGCVRGCLCHGCNRAEGKLYNVLKRFLSDINIPFEEFVRNLVKYWDYHERNPSHLLHPDHKTKFEKKQNQRKKAKKRRQAKKKEKQNEKI